MGRGFFCSTVVIDYRLNIFLILKNNNINNISFCCCFISFINLLYLLRLRNSLISSGLREVSMSKMERSMRDLELSMSKMERTMRILERNYEGFGVV